MTYYYLLGDHFMNIEAGQVLLAAIKNQNCLFDFFFTFAIIQIMLCKWMEMKKSPSLIYYEF